MSDWRQTIVLSAVMILAAVGIALCILKPWDTRSSDLSDLRLAVARLDSAITVSVTTVRFTELVAELQAQNMIHKNDLTQDQRVSVDHLVETSTKVASIWSNLSDKLDADTLDALVTIGALRKPDREKLRTVDVETYLADLRAGGFSKAAHDNVNGIKKNLISSALTVVGKEALTSLAKLQPVTQR